MPPRRRMTTPRSTRADARSHLTPVSTPSPSSPAYPHPHTHPHRTCTSTRTRSRAVHLDPIAHQVIEWLLKRDLERCLPRLKPRAAHTLRLLCACSAPALRLLCVCSARTLHPPCNLRSKAEAASEREAHSFEKIDFDGRARACVGCAGRLGTSHPTLSPRHALAGTRSCGVITTVRRRSRSARSGVSSGSRSRLPCTRATSSSSARSRSATRPPRCRPAR